MSSSGTIVAISERLARLEEGAKHTNRRLDDASDQRASIAASVNELKGLVGMMQATMQQLADQQPGQHEANQQAIATLTTRIDTLATTVATHEQERQQLRLAKKILIRLWIPFAAVLGWIADRAFDLLTRVWPPPPPPPTLPLP